MVHVCVQVFFGPHPCVVCHAQPCGRAPPDNEGACGARGNAAQALHTARHLYYLKVAMLVTRNVFFLLLTCPIMKEEKEEEKVAMQAVEITTAHMF